MVILKSTSNFVKAALCKRNRLASLILLCLPTVVLARYTNMAFVVCYQAGVTITMAPNVDAPYCTQEEGKEEGGCNGRGSGGDWEGGDTR